MQLCVPCVWECMCTGEAGGWVLCVCVCVLDENSKCTHIITNICSVFYAITKRHVYLYHYAKLYIVNRCFYSCFDINCKLYRIVVVML